MLETICTKYDCLRRLFDMVQASHTRFIMMVHFLPKVTPFSICCWLRPWTLSAQASFQVVHSNSYCCVHKQSCSYIEWTLYMEFVFWGGGSSFEKCMDTITHGLPYDYRSVTHHSAFHLARGSQPVIVPKNRSIPEDILGSGNDQFPTEYDILHINLVYCDGKSCIGKCILNA